jgi:hypothetical protein
VAGMAGGDLNVEYAAAFSIQAAADLRRHRRCALQRRHDFFGGAPVSEGDRRAHEAAGGLTVDCVHVRPAGRGQPPAFRVD